MICETCGATLAEASREVVTDAESRQASEGMVAQARASLASGGGSPAERQVWQMVADTGVDTAGTWAVMECPTGCAQVIVRIEEPGG